MVGAESFFVFNENRPEPLPKDVKVWFHAPVDERSKSSPFQGEEHGFESRPEYFPNGKHCRRSVRNFDIQSIRSLRIVDELREGFDVPRTSCIDLISETLRRGIQGIRLPSGERHVAQRQSDLLGWR